MSPARVEAAAALFALCSCTSPAFSEQEALLRDELRYREPLPSPTNAYADDPGAIALGHQLYFDRHFSGELAVDGVLGEAGDRARIACVVCHDLGAHGVDPRADASVSVGAGGPTARNAPTVFNVAWRERFGWDGRYTALWEQLEVPLAGGPHNLHPVVHAERLEARYAEAYVEVFGPFPNLASRRPPRVDPAGWYEELSPEDQHAIDRVFANQRMALEAYLRQLRSDDSAFEAFLDGEGEVSHEVRVGARLFVNVGCVSCHSGYTLSDGEFHVIGLDQRGAWDLGCAAAGRAGEAGCEEGGFATPPLRDVAETGPYMHDGSLATLEEVVRFYDRGGDASGFPGERDRRIVPLGLDDTEIHALVAFLESLTGTPGPAWAMEAP